MSTKSCLTELVIQVYTLWSSDYHTIADCTPDISHKEQMSIIVRFVKINSTECEVEICEHFVGFLQVDKTTATAVKDKVIIHLESLNISIADMRGQRYDNGANMSGKHAGVQKRILEINRPAFMCRATPIVVNKKKTTACNQS